MAFTRKGVAAILKDEGLEADQKLDEIFKLHTEVTTGLKDERDTYKEKAAKAEELQAELDVFKAKDGEENPFEEKYKQEHKAFEDYKKAVEAEKSDNATRSLYREQLEALGISAPRVNSIMKVADLETLKAYEVKDGKYAKPDDVAEAIKTEWADFIPQTSTKGASVAHPPKSGEGAAVTAEQFKKMTITERNELFKSDRETYNALAHPNE